MRFAFVVATIWCGVALAEEPAACYVLRDPTGDFAANKVQTLDAHPGTGAQIRHLLNEYNRVAAKCIQRHVEREGGWPATGAAILYGLRISPAGKLTQVSVLAETNVNDAMLMACIGRTFCRWELTADEDAEERLVKLPVVMSEMLEVGLKNRLRH